MTRADGNQTQAADMLGMNRNTLRTKLAKYGIRLSGRVALRRAGQTRGARRPCARSVRRRRSPHPACMRPITQALLSVSDKTGSSISRGASRLGVKLLSTGGTAKALADAGSAGDRRRRLHRFPEMLDGRVKTLHPKVHGGILARRDLPEHVAALAAHGIPPIDLVVVNLYPFRETVAKPGCTLDDAIENIDIGGPTMVRAAAKNWPHVGVVVDPADYAALLAELAANGGALSTATRFALARKAFAHTAAYDGAIANWLTARGARRRGAAFPDRVQPAGDEGAGPALRREPASAGGVLSRRARRRRARIATYPPAAGQGAVVQQHRRQRRRVGMREDVRRLRPRCVIVKHANPCGVAIAATPLEAYRKAFATDPDSAFGGIIAFNRAGRRGDASRRSRRSSSKC